MEPNDCISCEEALSDLPLLDIEKNEFDANSYAQEAINEYQKLMRPNGFSSLNNHEATRHKQFVIDTIKMVPEGGNHKDLPPGVGDSRTFNEAWTRYHSKKPSRTIDTGHRNHFHYKANRVPTVRENARLQSFPDDFRILGTRTSQNRQIGNAVPVFSSTSHSSSYEEVTGCLNRIIDLFAGCGGLSQGFSSGDSSVVASVEWDKACIDTIKANTGRAHRLFHVDIRAYEDYLTASDGLRDIAESDAIDGVVGGPPAKRTH